MKKNSGNIPKAANKSRKWLWVACCCLLFTAFVGCHEDDPDSGYDPNLPPTVTEVFPDSGRISDPVIIHGNNFGTDKSKIKVLFDNKEAAILTAENNHLYVLNPKQKGGDHTVKVVVDEKEATAPQTFKYIVSASVYTVAGTGEYDYVDGSALEAKFGRPAYLTIDDQGNLIVLDYDRWVRLVSIPERKVRTLLDAEDVFGCCFSSDYNMLYVGVEGKNRVGYTFQRNMNWQSASIMNDGNMNYTCDLATLDNGDIFVVTWQQRIGLVDKDSYEITVLGKLNSTLTGNNIDFHMTYNPHDRMMYIASYATHVIFRFDPYKESYTDADFELYAGKVGIAGYMDGTLANATFYKPSQMAFDEEGNMLVADRGNHVIRKITPDGIVTTFAGSEQGDADGKPEEAKFDGPEGLAIAPDGLVYVAERDGRKIRCIAIQ